MLYAVGFVLSKQNYIDRSGTYDSVVHSGNPRPYNHLEYQAIKPYKKDAIETGIAGQDICDIYIFNDKLETISIESYTKIRVEMIYNRLVISNLKVRRVDSQKGSNSDTAFLFALTGSILNYPCINKDSSEWYNAGAKTVINIDQTGNEPILAILTLDEHSPTYHTIEYKKQSEISKDEEFTNYGYYDTNTLSKNWCKAWLAPSLSKIYPSYIDNLATPSYNYQYISSQDAELNGLRVELVESDRSKVIDWDTLEPFATSVGNIPVVSSASLYANRTFNKIDLTHQDLSSLKNIDLMFKGIKAETVLIGDIPNITSAAAIFSNSHITNLVIGQLGKPKAGILDEINVNIASNISNLFGQLCVTNLKIIGNVPPNLFYNCSGMTCHNLDLSDATMSEGTNIPDSLNIYQIKVPKNLSATGIYDLVKPFKAKGNGPIILELTTEFNILGDNGKIKVPLSGNIKATKTGVKNSTAQLIVSQANLAIITKIITSVSPDTAVNLVINPLDSQTIAAINRVKQFSYIEIQVQLKET